MKKYHVAFFIGKEPHHALVELYYDLTSINYDMVMAEMVKQVHKAMIARDEVYSHCGDDIAIINWKKLD